MYPVAPVTAMVVVGIAGDSMLCARARAFEAADLLFGDGGDFEIVGGNDGFVMWIEKQPARRRRYKETATEGFWRMIERSDRI